MIELREGEYLSIPALTEEIMWPGLESSEPRFFMAVSFSVSTSPSSRASRKLSSVDLRLSSNLVRNRFTLSKSFGKGVVLVDSLSRLINLSITSSP